MKRYLSLLLLIAACHRPHARILIFSFSQSTGHPDSVRLRRVLDSMKFRVDTTSALLTDSTLTPYTAIVMLDADGDKLPFSSRVALKRYLEAGGGFIRIGKEGIMTYDWDWYKRLIADSLPFGARVFSSDTVRPDSILRVVRAFDGLDYAQATTSYPPDEAHFTKVPLVQGQIFEPTEMTILPNLDILFLQRRGEVMLYKNATQSLKQAGLLGVYWHTDKPGVNVEEGALGLCKDPDYFENHWVYIYYSVLDKPVNRLSRFTFWNDTLDPASEKTILEVETTRDICCHTGGSVAFSHNGLLFLSTGDNSTPFDKGGARYVNHGFAPLDQVPGDQQYDAERSSGNTNDLRGKILRIRVHKDGSYTIPEGNLFPPGTPNTRPEIYVMGDRNPYRISVDQWNSNLYWGEVGPDAGSDSLDTRGPRGYDEFNQARKAGNFGWPFFIGNNLAYHAYNYTNGGSGSAFDPQHPQNLSPNNTGLKDLPPAQSAFIWYPYANSPEFPELGTGGRTAMAGPVYRSDDYAEDTRYPAYYDGKLFIYEWMRGWIKAVSMNPKGDFLEMEPFMPHMPMHNCIDLEVGPDGRFYLLEYGTGWFTKNPDAGIYRIDYDPQASSLVVDSSGVVVDSSNPVIRDGRAIVQNLDCKSCHQENGPSVGPSFVRVSEKYEGHPDVEAYLTQKVMKGGSGVWGDAAMAAHPDINKDDLHKILQYVLALAAQKKEAK